MGRSFQNYSADSNPDLMEQSTRQQVDLSLFSHTTSRTRQDLSMLKVENAAAIKKESLKLAKARKK